MYCGSTEAEKKDQGRHSNQLHKHLEKIFFFRKQRDFAAIYTHATNFNFLVIGFLMPDYTKLNI